MRNLLINKVIDEVISMMHSIEEKVNTATCGEPKLLISMSPDLYHQIKVELFGELKTTQFEFYQHSTIMGHQVVLSREVNGRPIDSFTVSLLNPLAYITEPVVWCKDD